MNSYISGKIIKDLRENKKLTQVDLSNIINVSDKTISKWETGKGLPDISLIESLSKALGVSIIELLNGEYINNNNKSNNMINSCIYVCPICGNVIYTIGASVISCCGVLLPKLEAEIDNSISCDIVENEYYISIDHDMIKTHYISFIAYVTMDRFELVKLYPEQIPETRFLRRGKGIIYVYCNRDGLIMKRI